MRGKRKRIMKLFTKKSKRRIRAIAGLGLAAAMIFPGLAYAGDGGAGSGGDGPATGVGVGQIKWTYKDNYGPASNNIVSQVLIQMGINKYGASADNAINQGITGANSECVARYAARHHGSQDADCRLTGVGVLYTPATDNSFTGNRAGFTQQQWMDAWGAEVGGKQYTYKGVSYHTSDHFTGSTDTINSIVGREAAKDVAIIIVVLAQDEPPVAVPPTPPSKAITKGVSADSMINTTTITSKTGVGGSKMVFKDQITPHGVKYQVGNYKVTDNGADITNKFTYAHNGDTVTATWKGGDLTDNHEFKWSLDITVSLPDVNKVKDKGTVTWNDQPTGDTDEHEFPTWTPTPDKAWIRLVDGKYETVIDPSWSNTVGADNAVVLDGDSIAAAVNAPVSSNLAQAPESFTITDDFVKSDYLVDLGDLKDAKVFLSDADKDTESSIADIANTGEDVTSQFTITSDGTLVTATANAEFLTSLKGRSKAAQVTLVTPFDVNYANGEGAAGVREDAGVKPGSELDFCGIPSDTDTDGSETPFLNAGTEQINKDIQKTNEPKICGYVPPVIKDVVAAGDEDGTQASIDGKLVEAGEKVEYVLTTKPKLPKDLAYDVTQVTVVDSYDARTTADKQTIEVTDLSTGNRIPKTEYTTTWDENKSTFTLDFTDKYALEHWGAGMNPELQVRFEAWLNQDVKPGQKVENSWDLTLNHSITPSNKVVNTPPDPKPSKADTQEDPSINIDGKTAFKGDILWYRITLDAKDLTNEAYRVQKLGLIDDYDDEYVESIEDQIRLISDEGVDVTDKANIEIRDGVIYAFFKTVDTPVLGTGETLPGDPQPENLAEYADRDVSDRFTNPGIDQSLLGHTFELRVPVKVIKVTDGYVVPNTAIQVTNKNRKVTNTVTNPLKEINPKKDVIAKVGGDSINEARVIKDSTFLYQLDSSIMPGNRAYPIITDWGIKDDYDESHDQYTGQWAVYATHDVLNEAGTVLYATGTPMIINGEQQAAADGTTSDVFFTFEENGGVFTLNATAAYLQVASANNTSDQGYTLFVQMLRTKTGTVENAFDETINQVDRHSNVVKTVTPDLTPGIDIEKWDGDNHDTGDRDTADQALTVNGDTPITFRITNTGNVPLKHVTFDDKTIQGSGTVEDLKYPDNWDTLVLQPGEHVDITGTLKGVKEGDTHTDDASTTGVPEYPCPTTDENPFDDIDPKTPEGACGGDPIGDHDPWNGKREPVPAGLAVTGSDPSSLILAASLALGLGVSLTLASKKHRYHGAHLA